jgi:hypothetical protein
MPQYVFESDVLFLAHTHTHTHNVCMLTCSNIVLAISVLRRFGNILAKAIILVLGIEIVLPSVGHYNGRPENRVLISVGV